MSQNNNNSKVNNFNPKLPRHPNYDSPFYKKGGLGSTIGSSGTLIDQMAASIQQMEGYYPGTLAFTNNNPGNLVFANQPGATHGAGGFAAFPSYQDGLNALKNQISYQINKGQTLTQFFYQYAPPNTTNGAGATQTKNATDNYINFVAGAVGVDPNIPLINYQGSTLGNSSGSNLNVGESNSNSSLSSDNSVSDSSNGGVVGDAINNVTNYLTTSGVIEDAGLIAGAVATGDYVTASSILTSDPMLLFSGIGIVIGIALLATSGR